MLWFSFILGLNVIFLCFKLIIIHHHTQKQKKIKFKPRIKLNHNRNNVATMFNALAGKSSTTLDGWGGETIQLALKIVSCNITSRKSWTGWISCWGFRIAGIGSLVMESWIPDSNRQWDSEFLVLNPRQQSPAVTDSIGRKSLILDYLT